MNARFSKLGSFYETYSDRRYGLVAATAAVSLLLHLLLYTRVADMRFDLTAEIPEKYREPPAKRAVRFEHVRGDPARPLPVPEAGDPGAKPGVGMSSEELADIVAAPAMAFSAPPPSQAVLGAARVKEIEIARPAPADNIWAPRQDIIKVVDRIARDDIAPLPRRELFAIERVERAPDYAPAIELGRDVAAPVSGPEPDILPLGTGKTPDAPDSVEAVSATVTADDLTPALALSRFGEKPADITQFQAVDSRLMARTTVFRPPVPDGRKYFKLEIAPRDASQLPAVPKDIVFVQDASRSLAEQRLHFCKEGLASALRFVAPADRFNVASFRDETAFCFPGGWAPPTPENLGKARAFIEALHSRGDTDLFESLKSLMALPRDPRRPLIAVVVTDGKATAGLTASTQIIGEFSKLNDNMSLFVVGTQAKANAYLLDMLSFCNRGAQTIVRSGRWDIPDAIGEAVRGCASPVLGRVGVTTDTPSHAEIFPLPSANLYADRTLVYYGSCPEDVASVVMQVRGEGGEAKCDCVFRLDLEAAGAGGADIKDEWAQRKMHSIIGAYARNPTRALRAAMQDLSRETGVPVPYARELGR